MKIVIIADDLTGALDSSVAFSERGLRTVCALSTDQLAGALKTGADVIAVSTGSREVPEKVAIDRVQKVKDMLTGLPPDQQGIWFKKIDSRLKGNVRAEISTLRQQGQKVFIAPAIPKLGRYVKDGMLCGMGVQDPISIAEKICLHDATIIDANSDSELEWSLEQMPKGSLLAGAAGASAALAKIITPGASPQALPELYLPALLAVGSTDPITLRQLEPLNALLAPNGQFPHQGFGEHNDLSIIQMVPGEERIDGDTAAARFSGSIVDWLKETNPRTLFVTGGETAAAIMDKLGCGLLEVKGEVLPGLPCALALNGFPGLKVVTKSGGFGSSETVVNFIDILVKE